MTGTWTWTILRVEVGKMARTRKFACGVCGRKFWKLSGLEAYFWHFRVVGGCVPAAPVPGPAA